MAHLSNRIYQYPSVMLEYVSTKVEPYIIKLPPQDRKLVKDMKEYVNHFQGFGLSAVQMGFPKRFFVAPSEKSFLEFQRNQRKTFELQVYVNPVIHWQSFDNQSYYPEACFSVPGKLGYIRRPNEMEMSYITGKGVEKRKRFSGMLSRILQHEYDHLEGILFIERLRYRQHLFDEEVQSKYIDDNGVVNHDLLMRGIDLVDDNSDVSAKKLTSTELKELLKPLR